MTKIKTYNVLWIDDEPNEEFMNNAYEEGIIIENHENHTAGFKALNENLQHWDAVILDANCKITGDETESPNLESLTHAMFEIYKLCTQVRAIPWFVYTGGGYQHFDSLATHIPERKWDDRKYYSKPSQRDELFNNIKKAVDAPEWKIRNEHHDLFQIFQKAYLNIKDENLLLNIFLKFPTNNKSELKSVLTNIRSLQECIYNKLESINILPVGLKFTARNKHLSGNQDSSYKPTTKIYQSQSLNSLAFTIYNVTGQYIHELNTNSTFSISNYAVGSLINAVCEQLLWFKEIYEINKP